MILSNNVSARIDRLVERSINAMLETLSVVPLIVLGMPATVAAVPCSVPAASQLRYSGRCN
jgi:hypothetical protein